MYYSTHLLLIRIRNSPHLRPHYVKFPIKLMHQINMSMSPVSHLCAYSLIYTTLTCCLVAPQGFIAVFTPYSVVDFLNWPNSKSASTYYRTSCYQLMPRRDVTITLYSECDLGRDVSKINFMSPRWDLWVLLILRNDCHVLLTEVSETGFFFWESFFGWNKWSGVVRLMVWFINGWFEILKI